MSHQLLAALAKQDRDIAAVGWAVTGGLPDGDDAPYAYTVGLTELGVPELVITGLHHDIAHALLNDMAARAYHGGGRWRHHDRVSDLIEGFDAIVVDGTANDLVIPGTANARYGAQHVRLQQIVWPDPGSRFPWESGYQYPPAVQPLLTQAPRPGPETNVQP